MKIIGFSKLGETHSCLCHQEDRLAISRQVSHLLIGHLTVVCQAQVWLLKNLGVRLGIQYLVLIQVF